MKVGHLKKGTLNHILDVPGGLGLTHRSFRDPAQGICTGFTVIHSANQILARRAAAISVLNGVGEIAGSHQIQEWGYLETPIVLTNSVCVGRAYDGISRWMMKKNARIGQQDSIVIPVVGETNDQILNDPRKIAWTEEDLFSALDDAYDLAQNPKQERLKQSLEQGDVGAGTGTVSFNLKAGIGSSSRQVEIRGKTYTVGILLQTNFGKREYFQMLGQPMKDRIDLPMPEDHCEGSCIGVLATDVPLDSHGLKRLASRMGMGLVRTGSVGHDSSGEIMLAFSTDPNPRHDLSWGDDEWNPLFWAAAEASEEAVYQSLLHARPVENIRAKVPALSQVKLDIER